MRRDAGWACALIATTFTVPAWDETDHDIDSGKLARLAKHVSALTPGELQEMQRVNPNEP